MAVTIRMKMMGRKHRAYFRICATDVRAPRDGRVIEELGTYNPHVPLTDARCTLNHERLQYWLSVGAKPSEKVEVLIKKYGPNGTHKEQQAAAVAQIKAPKVVPDPGEPKLPKPKQQAEAPAAEASESSPGVDAPAAE